MYADERLLDNFNFGRFIRMLLRRVSSLSYYYAGYEFYCDFKELSCQAAAVVCTENNFVFSRNENRSMNGLVGNGLFKGDFGGFMPFLCAGLYFHVGKGST
jgi:hypothetical protein